MLPSLRLAALVVLGGALFAAAPLWPPLVGAAVVCDAVLILCCVADWLLLRAGDTLAANRQVAPTFSLAVPNLVRVSVSNPTGRVVEVALRDDPPPGFHVDHDRFRCTLSPRETWSGTYHVTPTQRGDHTFGDLHLRIRTRLGLLIRQRSVTAHETVRVYPDLRKVQQYEMLARQRRASMMGIRRLRQLGSGLEFEQLRDYQPDDEVRHIDWKASARCGALMVRQFAPERSQRVVLVLDLGHTMATRLGDLSKVDHALNACVLLAHVAIVSEDRVGLYTFADGPGRFMPPKRGRRQMLNLVEALYPVHGQAVAADYGRAFAALADRLGQRSLVILFTDLVDPDSSRVLIEAIGLLARRHLVLCVAFGDYELQELIRQWPDRDEDLYRQAVAASMVEDRQRALAALARRGVLTLDATPTNLSVAVVNRYLQIKAEARG